MDKEKDFESIKPEMEIIGSELMLPVMRLRENLLADISGTQVKQSEGFMATLDRLVQWAAAASAELGSERTLAVLEAAAMIGYLSAEMQDELSRHIYASAPTRIYTHVITRTQLRLLKQLMTLLGKKRVSDLVLLQVTTQIVLTYRQPGSYHSQANN